MCTEQVVDFRNLFCYLGVTVCKNSYVWGDNKSQVTSSIFPHTRLNKRHNILSFNYVRNIVTQGFINITHIPSEHNLADVLSKNWSFQACYENLIKLLLSYNGDGADYNTINLNKMLDAGIDFEFDINIQAFSTSGLKFDKYPMGSDKF